jgi:hypothetical protein
MRMRKTLIALIAVVSFGLAGALLAGPRLESDAQRLSTANATIDILGLTGSARDLAEQSYPAH